MVNKLISFITIDEFKKLLGYEKDKRFKLAMVLGFGSGLRLSEVVGGIRKDGTIIPPLHQEDVLLEEHQIRIRGAKGKKDRVTVTSPWLNQTNIKLLPLNIPRRTLQDRMTKLSEKVLGRRISFHTLRHGFGNFMANEQNIPMPQLQIMMGHSRIDTTGIYTKANPKQATDAGWNAWEKF